MANINYNHEMAILWQLNREIKGVHVSHLLNQGPYA